MATKGPSTAVGVFDTPEQAEQAIAELWTAGFYESLLGMGAQHIDPRAGASGPPTRETGAAIGGMSGAARGGMAVGPPGMLGGAFIGLRLGTRIDLEIPEDDARWYSDEAAAGRQVVTVQTHGRYADAHEILFRHGGKEAPAPAL